MNREDKEFRDMVDEPIFGENDIMKDIVPDNTNMYYIGFKDGSPTLSVEKEGILTQIVPK